MKILNDGTSLLASSPNISGIRKMVKDWSFDGLEVKDDLTLMDKETKETPEGLRVTKKNGRYRFEMTGLK